MVSFFFVRGSVESGEILAGGSLSTGLNNSFLQTTHGASLKSSWCLENIEGGSRRKANHIPSSRKYEQCDGVRWLIHKDCRGTYITGQGRYSGSNIRDTVRVVKRTPYVRYLRIESDLP